MKHINSNSSNIQVYLLPGRFSNNLLKNTKKLIITDGLDSYHENDDEQLTTDIYQTSQIQNLKSANNVAAVAYRYDHQLDTIKNGNLQQISNGANINSSIIHQEIDESEQQANEQNIEFELMQRFMIVRNELLNSKQLSL